MYANTIHVIFEGSCMFWIGANRKASPNGISMPPIIINGFLLPSFKREFSDIRPIAGSETASQILDTIMMVLAMAASMAIMLVKNASSMTDKNAA